MKKLLFTVCLLAGLVVLNGCQDDPEPENIPELITKVRLRFTPVGGGTEVVVTASDPDLDGPRDLEVDGPIALARNTQYTLSIELLNELFGPNEEGYDVGEEVEEEADEHQFFFRWTAGVFSSPTGTGNILDAPGGVAGAVNYLDEDANGRPLGLRTSWTTINEASQGAKSFRVVLMHQPGIKSATSTNLDGEDDVDITFVISVN